MTVAAPPASCLISITEADRDVGFGSESTQGAKSTDTASLPTAASAAQKSPLASCYIRAMFVAETFAVRYDDDIFVAVVMMINRR